jgi:hypothetical protein
MSVMFYAFCQTCGDEVSACASCTARRAQFAGLCGDCVDSNRSETSGVSPIFICDSCDVPTTEEIIRYTYTPFNPTAPLSPLNVVRTPVYRYAATLTHFVARAEEARVAYETELAFSGDRLMALSIYTSFYPPSIQPTERPSRTDPISLRDILNGRPVTGERDLRTS